MSHCLSRCSSVSSSMYDQEIWSSSSEVPRIFKRISEVPKPRGLTTESHKCIEQKRRYYSFPLHDSVLKPILKNIHNVRKIKDFKIPDNLPNGIYNELARLKISLIAYEELVEDKLFDPLLILEQTLTLGPTYADWLKDFRDYSVKISGAIQMVSDDELDVTCTENLKSWDQIFPPEYLFPFERDCQKDYELMFEASRDPEKDIVDAFRRKVRNIIRKDMNKIAPPRHDDLDFLSSMGSQSSFDLKGKKRVPKSFLLAKNGKGKPPDKGSFLCSPAWKNAAEMRAAVIPTPDTLISLLMLERMSSLCFRIKEDVFWKRDFSFLPRYLSRYDTIYISADIKKFGLTFPIWLVKEVIDAIDETYPLWDIQRYAKAILNREIYFLDEEEPRTPKRGFGMGMINGIGSICMALLFKVFKDSIEIPENYRLDGIFYNDDQEFRLINLKGGLDVSSEELAVDLTYKWNEFCGRAGLTMHKKKPFISRNGLFCEVYGENFPVNCNKKFKRYVNLLNSFSSCNIVEAKNFVSSVVPCLEIDEGYLKYFISRCISFFGYEFNREECVLPFELGGWTPFIDGGNNCLFDFMVNCSHHFHQYFGLVKTHRRIQTDRKAPSYRKYVEFYKDWIDNNIIESIPQLDFASMLRSAIGAPNRDTVAEVKSWENFKRLRMKSVMNFRKSKQTIGSLIRELISEKLSSGRGLYSIPKEYIDPEDESWIEVSDVKRIMVSMPRIFDLGRTFLSMNKFMGRIDIDIYSFHEHIDLPPLVKAYLEFFLLALWLGYKEGRSTRELEHLLICGLGYQQKMIAHIRSMLPSAVGFNGCTAEVISYRKFCTVKGLTLVDNEHMLWAPPGTPWLRPIAKEPFFQSDEELYIQWKNTWSENTHEILDSRYDDFLENVFWKNILTYYTSFYERFLEKKKNTVPRDKMDPLSVDIDREIKDSLIEIDGESELEFSDDDQGIPDFEYNFELEENSPDLYPMETDEVYVVGEGENADEFEDIEDFDCDFSFPDPSEIG